MKQITTRHGCLLMLALSRAHFGSLDVDQPHVWHRTSEADSRTFYCHLPKDLTDLDTTCALIPASRFLLLSQSDVHFGI